MTIQVHFPSTWYGWTTPECTLSPAFTTPDHGYYVPDKTTTVIVDPKTTADYHSDSPVFRAYFLRPNGSTSVVLKFAMRDDLIDTLVEEANVYTGQLEPLQGAAIPRYYGLYAGTLNGQTVACLMLEYCGECLRRPFDRLSVDLRLRILHQLREIHKCGFIHGDFAERNVLEKNGDIRIIDFDQTIRHDCNCRLDFRPGEKLLDSSQVGCEQLWEVYRYRMRLITPSEFKDSVTLSSQNPVLMRSPRVAA
ncbi:hypothetical protein Agabi119p4_7957 [Agaricus bisporus var. burnettii]|uniref:non-specific serine/threonine protein kinase n=1 Tax=Agaricus bisporus var. burnettii TaxID=192524 RepID=A0A8H7C692_AGABI|nr:hypothetical protein Agabi119p4_7957 [Agaricus bisporus var. burnettii]